MRRFDAVLEPFGPAAAVTLPFDPKAEWGKVRAPVRGTIDGHPFSTTVARYGGVDYLAFRREVREAASVEVGAVVAIEVELDTSERVVTVPRTSSPRLRTAVCARRSTRSRTRIGRSTRPGSRKPSVTTHGARGSAVASTC